MDKYTSGVFASTKYGIYKSAQDIITSLPATIIADGQSASAVVKGNMSQSGTPTPATPIYPTESGDLETTGDHADQYKIPILSGNTTTNVYLGETQSTRTVYKYIFTGQENDWRITGSGRMACILPTISLKSQTTPCICSHYIGVGTSSIGSINNGECSTNTTDNEFIAYDTNYTTLADFKTFLQQQYANNSPVTVWYVLSTPTTTTLNEPIRKIGTYADSVSVSAIPTTAGSQTFDIDTTLKPSEVDLTYNGWHLYNDKKYTSGAWS